MVTGRVCWVVVGEGTFIQRRQSISGKTVVKGRWSFVRGVIHEEFYCIQTSTFMYFAADEATSVRLKQNRQL